MSLVDGEQEQKRAILKARGVAAALHHVREAQEDEERFGDTEDLDVAEARLANWLAEQPTYVTEAVGLRLVIRLTREQRRRVRDLIPVYGNDPQSVGEVDGTEDDFGDLIGDTLGALGYEWESDDQAWQRVQEMATLCDAEDLVEWASVLDLAWRADPRLRDGLTEDQRHFWPREEVGT